MGQDGVESYYHPVRPGFFFFQAEGGIRYIGVTGVQTCALPIYPSPARGGLLPRERGHLEAPSRSGDSGWEPETALGGRSGDDGPWLPTWVPQSHPSWNRVHPRPILRRRLLGTLICGKDVARTADVVGFRIIGAPAGRGAAWLACLLWEQEVGG